MDVGKLTNLARERLKDLDGHVLEVVCDIGRVKVYNLRRPGTRNMLVQLSFTPEGIAIQGDFTPEETATCSKRSQSLEWFCGILGIDYLAEKFLSKGWHVDNVREWLLNIGADSDAHSVEVCSAAYDLAQSDDEVLADPAQVRGEIDQFTQWDWCDSSPHGYKPQEMADLWAIQSTFAKLHGEHMAPKPAKHET